MIYIEGRFLGRHYDYSDPAEKGSIAGLAVVRRSLPPGLPPAAAAARTRRPAGALLGRRPRRADATGITV